LGFFKGSGSSSGLSSGFGADIIGWFFLVWIFFGFSRIWIDCCYYWYKYGTDRRETETDFDQCNPLFDRWNLNVKFAPQRVWAE
jgi:hypothetical protein